jgi:endonuclease I
MNKLLKFRYLHIFLSVILFTITVQAQIPAGYYDSAADKKGAALKTALYQIIKEPNFWQGKYSSAASFFESADRTADGYIWDMYSNKQCTRWSGCGLNREHNLPKSWFGVTGGNEDRFSIGCDYHNLYPSDADANSAKSNFPLGEVKTATFTNGVVKVGKSNIKINNGAYNGNVFEPADQYKGDFARNYMYMVTCYEDYAPKWTTTYGMIMLVNNTYPTFSQYSIDLLMKWHRQDPVSQKEIDRNNAVYQRQGNRNPFVDHPEYAGYIWGQEPKEKLTKSTFPIYYYQKDKEIELRIGSEVGSSEYTIYNISGSKVLAGKLAENSTIISVESLSQGLYVVILYDKIKNIRRVGKFVNVDNSKK